MSRLFDEALSAEGISGSLAALARSIYAQESGSGKNTKTSHAGARGGMQIIPSTFASVADKDWSIDDPMHNARAGIRYLKQLHEKADGDPRLTAAGYYGGPGGLEKARRGVAVSDPKSSKAPNTLQYADQVVARMGDVPVEPRKEVAPSQGAPIVARAAVTEAVPSGPVPLPPEFLAAIQPRSPANAGQPTSDAWVSFLEAMPQNKQPVQVADLDFMTPSKAAEVPRFQFNPAPRTRPNFDLFAGFGKFPQGRG